MKGFPTKPTGPMGPLYKRVNEAVAAVRVGDSRQALLNALGDPNEVRTGQPGSGAALQALMENVAGGPTEIQYGSSHAFEEILVFRDPYRPRHRYMFGIDRGIITSVWRETVADAKA